MLSNALDSLILKKGGLARVTAVARSNYDAVNGVHPSTARSTFVSSRSFDY